MTFEPGGSCGKWMDPLEGKKNCLDFAKMIFLSSFDWAIPGFPSKKSAVGF